MRSRKSERERGKARQSVRKYDLLQCTLNEIQTVYMTVISYNGLLSVCKCVLCAFAQICQYFQISILYFSDSSKLLVSVAKELVSVL